MRRVRAGGPDHDDSAGRVPCLACLYPEPPRAWPREFPVFGAVLGAVGCIAAREAIKVLSDLGEPLTGRRFTYDLRDVSQRTVPIRRDPDCAVCGGLTAG